MMVEDLNMERSVEAYGEDNMVRPIRRFGFDELKERLVIRSISVTRFKVTLSTSASSALLTTNRVLSRPCGSCG